MGTVCYHSKASTIGLTRYVCDQMRKYESKHFGKFSFIDLTVHVSGTVITENIRTTMVTAIRVYRFLNNIIQLEL